MAAQGHSSPMEEDIQVNVPFLPRRSRYDIQDGYSATEGVDDEPLSAPQDAMRRRVLITLTVVMLGIESGAHMIPGPMTRIIESISCRQYFVIHDPSRISASGHVAEQLCKIPEVQKTVTITKGFSDFFEGLSSTLLSIPFGLLADRHGRKRAIHLTVPGFILNAIITITVLWFPDVFPLQSIWLAALSWILGGGPTVAMAVLWTMAADVTTESQRTMIYTRIFIITMASNFAAKIISSILMSLNPWTALIVGCAVLLVALSSTFLLPETFELAGSKAKMDVLISRSSIDISVASHSSRAPRKQSWLDSGLGKLRRVVSPYIFILHFQLALLLSTFFIYQFSQCSSSFLEQYISTRYNLSLASASFIVSLQPAINVPVFLFGIPYLSNHHLCGLHSLLKDQFLARVSSVCLTLGALGVGLSPYTAILIPSLLLNAAGSGFVFMMRSIVTGLVQREQTATLYTAIQVLQSIGSVIGIYALTNVFSVGLKLSGLFVGLGWIISGALFAVLALIVWMVELPESVRHRHEDG